MWQVKQASAAQAGQFPARAVPAPKKMSTSVAGPGCATGLLLPGKAVEIW
jgi:hypothetical protein